MASPPSIFDMTIDSIRKGVDPWLAFRTAVSVWLALVFGEPL